MIFIPHNVPSSKNGKVMEKYKPKSVRKYLQKIGVKAYNIKKQEVEDYVRRPNQFRLCVGDSFKDVRYPQIVGFHFVRSSRRKFDFHNAIQIVADLLTAHGFIEDDDMDHFIPVPFKIDDVFYHYDKDRAGVYLRLMGPHSQIDFVLPEEVTK